MSKTGRKLAGKTQPTCPRCATRSLGGRYIDGKPRRGPARYTEVHEVHEATSTLHNGQRRPHNTSAGTTQLGRTIHQWEAQRGPAKVPQRITRFKKQPHSNRTSAGTTRSLGGRIHHRGAHRGPAEVTQRSAEVPQRSTMVNDGHTTRPRCATRSLGGRYINGKPKEVPPHTRRSTRCT